MTAQLSTSVDFTVPFYQSRVVVATTRRSRQTGWSSARLGRPLTTTVWVAGGGVVLVLALLIGVASCSGRMTNDEQPTLGDATPSAAATSTSRRRRLKNTLRPRESINI